MRLPAGFLDRPVAHRALHGQGRPENSLSAIRAAVSAGYGIEIDVQPSRDGTAMVFHDSTLERMTESSGPVRAHEAGSMSALRLAGSKDEIPTLAEALDVIGGRVPLVIEMKDQTGGLNGSDGVLEAGVVSALADYAGPVAVMSFNPQMIARMADLAPDVPRGLTTCGFEPEVWSLPTDTLDRLREIADYDTVGGCFISHDAADLSRPQVSDLRARGAAILCWTIRTPAQADAALRHADQITFEGFTPA